MRVDKYLWHIRYFKSRSNATDACNKGHVSILTQKMKPSREINIGDKIEIRKEQIYYSIEVLAFPENRVGAKLVAIYCKDITDPIQLEKLELLKLSKDYYRLKGTGRPTKKDQKRIGWVYGLICNK
jgi:ribosome-associated heat shock protein Hsp15